MNLEECKMKKCIARLFLITMLCSVNVQAMNESGAGANSDARMAQIADQRIAAAQPSTISYYGKRVVFLGVLGGGVYYGARRYLGLASEQDVVTRVNNHIENVRTYVSDSFGTLRGSFESSATQAEAVGAEININSEELRKMHDGEKTQSRGVQAKIQEQQGALNQLAEQFIAINMGELVEGSQQLGSKANKLKGETGQLNESTEQLEGKTKELVANVEQLESSADVLDISTKQAGNKVQLLGGGIKAIGDQVVATDAMLELLLREQAQAFCADNKWNGEVILAGIDQEIEKARTREKEAGSADRTSETVKDLQLMRFYISEALEAHQEEQKQRQKSRTGLNLTRQDIIAKPSLGAGMFSQFYKKPGAGASAASAGN